MASNSQGDYLHDGKEWHLRVKEIISIPYKGLSLSLVNPISTTHRAYLFEGKIPPRSCVVVIVLLSVNYKGSPKLAPTPLIPSFLISMRVMRGRLSRYIVFVPSILRQTLRQALGSQTQGPLFLDKPTIRLADLAVSNKLAIFALENQPPIARTHKRTLHNDNTVKMEGQRSLHDFKLLNDETSRNKNQTL